MRLRAWRVLTGLPGGGPPPVHFHRGHPTPWREGVAIRFEFDDGQAWVGNFQSGRGWFTAVQEWPQADALVVGVKGNLFLIPVAERDNYTAHRSGFVSRVMLTADERLLFVAAHTWVYAYRPELTVAWKRSGAELGGSHVELEGCHGKRLTLSLQEADGAWRPLHLRTRDGRPC